MESNVFTSNIKRDIKPLQNNLYDLVNVEVAKPSPQVKEIEHPCNFIPNTGKVYKPKRKNKFVKVKTVRDVRGLFETDILVDLNKDLDKQQNLLLKKITLGSSRETLTKSLATSMIECDKPVSRATWQMLMTLNPKGHTHAIQYALWNGKLIRINGSRGGKNKFIYNYDLAHRKVKKREIRNKVIPKKTGLLNNSLSVKFKPGPLSKKHVLDESYQKYNFGITKIVDLPKPGLDVHPKYGVTLEPRISNFIQNLRDPRGIISDKWAEFAVSVLGTNKNSVPVQCNKDPGVTFELNYECKQQRVLMRCHESERIIDKPIFDKNKTFIKRQENLNDEVKRILNDIIDSVDISLQQENMYTGEDEPRDNSIRKNTAPTLVLSKDKPKRRCGELDRLDVTIIRLPETSKGDNAKCNNAHCSLGCICASLRCEYNLKRHCGRLECMFECKCDFTKYKGLDFFDSDCPELIPGLVKLDNELSFKLAKEEQKFHQTVVVTGEKSILLKPERRNWKTSKRYGDFFNNMSLKNDMKSQQSLSVICTKLNCQNIEPWCMVHNLYKCFCKGIFTYGLDSVLIEKELNKTLDNKNEPIFTENSINANSNTNTLSRYESKRIRKSTIEHKKNIDLKIREEENDNSTCARLNPYRNRNYSNKYYKSMHQKILKMEKNDDSLRKKMSAIINNLFKDTSDIPVTTNKKKSKQVSQDLNQNSNMFQSSKPTSETRPSSKVELVEEINSSTSNTPHKFTINDPCLNKSVIETVSNKTKLIAWLETNYKAFKERESNRRLKNKKCLDPPKHGKVALYPWEFILSRYRERKNLFLVSKREPFRLFMSIDAEHSFFDNCMNIDDIRFNDLSKYPVTIKNLLTNAEYLKDNFCILCGLAICWELIGSVTKVPDAVDIKKQVQESENDQRLIYDYEDEPCRTSPTTESSNADKLPEQKNQASNVVQEQVNENPEISRWFIMTIENDFSEIQFHNRGFFVKCESIIKALNFARLSRKTVRLSQKTFDNTNDPQFGLYAIPNANEYYVLVGPYEKDEPLGIETVKSISDVAKRKKTRGVWIQTKKVDNIKIIDNPLSFIPLRDSESNTNLTEIPSQSIPKSTTENSDPSTTDNSKLSTEAGCFKDPGSNVVRKVVKPIKIRKTNGFYHLTSKNSKPQIEPMNQLQNNSKPLLPLLKSAIPETSIWKGPPTLLVLPLTVNPIKNTKTPENCLENNSTADALDSTSQIKIVNVYSEKDETDKHTTVNKKPERGMLILKPEEINKRLMENKLMPSNVVLHPCDSSSSDLEITRDNKKKIYAPSLIEPMNTDTVILSDDDDDICKHYPNLNADVVDIWIECIDYENLGWIAGRKNSNDKISFQFPGFLFTDFYDKEDAFFKINQVLSRKVYMPNNMHLKWRIVECKEKLKVERKLTSKDLGSDFVLTKKGLRHRSDMIGFSKNLISNNASVSDMAPEFANASIFTEMDKAIDMMSDFEEQSKTLDDENDMLINELRTGGKLLGTIKSAPDNEKELISQTLQTFITDSAESKNKKIKPLLQDTDTTKQESSAYVPIASKST